MSRKIILLLLTVLLPSVAQLQAQEPSFDELSELSFDDFLNLRVSAVSRKNESAKNAPGIIDTITAADIKRLGVQTVAEAISFATGVMSYDSYFTQYNQFAIRGNLGSEHYNTKLLMTVNGHPVYSLLHGGFEVNSIPIDIIERIEIVRGPASVLYGTNALTGVIAITTKKDLKGSNIKVLYQRSSFDTNEGRATLADSLGDLNIIFSTTIRDADGQTFVARPEQDEAGNGYAIAVPESYNSFFLGLQYQNFEMDFSYWSEESASKLGILPHSTFTIPFWEQDHFFTNIRYNKDLSESVSLHARARYERDLYNFDNEGIYILEESVYGIPPVNQDPTRWDSGSKTFGGEIYLDIAASENLNVRVGSLYDRYYDVYFHASRPDIPGGLSPISAWTDGRKSNSDVALYSRIDYQVSEKLKAIGGLRYTENRIAGDNISTRAGLVASASDSLTFKALYGTSYRAPNLFELNTITDSPILRGNLNLEPETLESLDFNIHYQYEELFTFSLTYFIQETDDFIRRVPGMSNVPTYNNTEGEKSQGIELQSRASFSDSVTAFVNASFLFEDEDKESGQGLLVPHEIISAGFSVDMLENMLTFSNANRYVGDWGGADHYVNSNLAVRFRPLTEEPQLEIYFLVNNVLNENIDYAEFSRRNIETIPGDEGRAYAGGISWQF